MAEYYAINRHEQHLMHYGIKGMRWGVRKAIERKDSKAYARHYHKALKKLAKLEKRANNGAKYARRAAMLGTAAGLTGGVAFQGAGGIVSGLTKRARNIRKAANNSLNGEKLAKAEIKSQKLDSAARSLSEWSRATPFAESAKKKADAAYREAVRATTEKGGKYYNISEKAKREYRMAIQKKGEDAIARANKLTRGKMLRAGAVAATAGLLGAAGYNAYRAATTKRAAAKADQWRNEINKTFGTNYSKKKRRGFKNA